MAAPLDRCEHRRLTKALCGALVGRISVEARTTGVEQLLDMWAAEAEKGFGGLTERAARRVWTDKSPAGRARYQAILDAVL